MHDDVDRMRRALAEGHALFAAAHIHVGWYRLFLPGAPPRIERRPDDGKLATDGLYEMDEGSFGTMTFLFGERTVDWSRRRIAVVTDDGRRPTPETINKYREQRDRYMAAEIYPFFVVWETSWGDELVDELDRWTRYHAARNGAGEPPYGGNAPFVHEAVRASVARPIWQQLVERATRAATIGGGAHTLAAALARKRTQMDFELHVVATGAGDLLQSAVLAELPSPVATATAVVSATPVGDAVARYGAALDAGRLGQLHLVSFDGAEWFGPIDGSLLDVVAELLAPTETEPVALLGRPTDDNALGALRTSGRVVERNEVAEAGRLLASAIATMLADVPPPPRPARAPSPLPARLPADPLARAEALRRANS